MQNTAAHAVYSHPAVNARKAPRCKKAAARREEGRKHRKTNSRRGRKKERRRSEARERRETISHSAPPGKAQLWAHGRDISSAAFAGDPFKIEMRADTFVWRHLSPCASGMNGGMKMPFAD